MGAPHTDEPSQDEEIALRIVRKIAGGPDDGCGWDAWYIDVSVDLDAEEMALLDRLHNNGGSTPSQEGET